MNALSISIPKIMLIVIVALLALLPIALWDHFNLCDEDGAFRMVVTSIDGGNISGKIIGRGARGYRTQRAKIVVYSKIDAWYREPRQNFEVALERDCTWHVTKLNDGLRYAAYLIDKEFIPDNLIPAEADAITHPLSDKDKEIIAWVPWGNWTPKLTNPQAAAANNWLTQQLVPNDVIKESLPNRSGLIISYRIPKSDDKAFNALSSRSWIYDDALAVIGFVSHGNQAQSLNILNATKGLIKDDGRIGFSYNTNNDWYHENYLSGPIAWLGYATVLYQQKTGDSQSQASAEQIADYLLELQNTDRASNKYGSILNSPNSSSYTTADNIITFFFLRDLGQLTGNDMYTIAAESVKTSLLDHHWNEDLGRFDTKIDDPTIDLIEANSLGSLFLLAVGEIDKAQRSMDFVENTYYVSAGKRVSGYAPYKERLTIWSQSSLQMAIAYKRTGDIAKYETIVQEIIKLQNERGGVPYASDYAEVANEGEFQEWPSVAGTAWLTIVLSENENFLGR